MNQQIFDKVKSRQGFIAALDQSGGSTPKALRSYGVGDDEWSGDREMFDRIHQMRTRIITSPSFSGDKILGAILFEDTMDREIEGVGTAQYLWERKQIVPFLKVDKGMEDEEHGVTVMKPIPGLDELLERAKAKGVFGTKMRSVIHVADQTGVDAILDQQFEVGRQIAAAGLVPILEPEIDINSPSKAGAEDLLLAGCQKRLDELDGEVVMLKLTLPEQDDLYRPLVDHDNVLAVVALSGGYSRDEANARLSRNKGVVASFSRALLDALNAQQTDEEFDAALHESVDSIYVASVS
jgi:fructose-bisphosphate aldolase class I